MPSWEQNEPSEEVLSVVKGDVLELYGAEMFFFMLSWCTSSKYAGSSLNQAQSLSSLNSTKILRLESGLLFKTPGRTLNICYLYYYNTPIRHILFKKLSRAQNLMNKIV